jgi:hypothetical protein
MLAEGGKIFIAVPNANALSRQIAVNMGIINYNHDVPEGEAAQGHLRTYALDTFLFEFKKVQMEVIDSGGVSFNKSWCNHISCDPTTAKLSRKRTCHSNQTSLRS